MKISAVRPGVFLLLCLFLLGCRPKIDAVMDDAFLRRGGEYWELFYLNEKQVGFQRTAVTNEKIDGKPATRFQRQSRIIVLRYGKKVDLAMKIDARSGSGGEFDSCRVEIDGGETIVTTCRVEDGKLLVETADGDAAAEKPWMPRTPGPESFLYELIADPMTVGGRRQVAYFEPALQRRVEATLHGEGIDRVDFDGKPRKLLRIKVENRIDGAGSDEPQRETLWTDAAGNILRRECPMGDGQMLVAVRSNRDKATALMNREPSGELGNLGIVPLNRAVADVQNVRRLVFFVQMNQGRPAGRFPVGPFQDVEPTADGRTAKITVWSAVSDGVGNPAFEGKTVEAKPEDLASNRLIDLDDPKLLELAATVQTDPSTPWQTALALERLVHETITKADFSTAFASSSEVLRTRSGDCTEYAVLLAALCRAKKIPARIALGLVYTPFTPQPPGDTAFAEAGMAFHLWNEVLVDGVWRPLDATSARGGADAGRIKIADDSLSENSPTALAGNVLDVLGRIRINVVE